MILKQYYLGCLAHASYLIGDTTSQTAFVVDPQRDVDQYLEDATRLGLRIRHVLLTHFHADFVAGHLELRDSAGATVYLGAKARADYAFTPLHDGDVIEFGPVRLVALETPGHTPEGLSLLVHDLEKSAARPHAVLTGDTLFIGDVGRPDLLASVGVSAEDLAGMLYDSLHCKLLALPDGTLVYPAHGAGSLCGKNLSTETVSTIGVQRRYNYALQPMSKEAFIRLVMTDQAEAPKYFAYDALLNRRERATLAPALERLLKPLSLPAVLDLQRTGTCLLDVRNPSEFAGAHLAASINIGLSGQFAPWAGALLDLDRPIVIISEPGREEEAARRLARVGADRVEGYLEGGMEALASHPDVLARTERITAPTLAEQMAQCKALFLLDVRSEREWREKRIGGSCNIPLGRLQDRLHELPRNRSIIVHCAGGYRSSIAGSILARHGFPDVADLVGGVAAWEASKLPVKTYS